jgi:dolichol-phosphate mannosyltransferase
VDDGSPDGTGKIADKMASANSQIRVLHRLEKSGLGKAYIKAFQLELCNEYTHFIQMDADGSHRPEHLNELINLAKTNDLVIGSRWVKGGQVLNWPRNRELISRLGNFYINLILKLRVADATAGYRIYSRKLLETLPLDEIAAKGYAYQIEMTYRSKSAGAKIVEAPITFVERVSGHSKMTLGIVLEALLLVTYWGLSDLVQNLKGPAKDQS